jgi:hypothetical protein
MALLIFVDGLDVNRNIFTLDEVFAMGLIRLGGNLNRTVMHKHITTRSLTSRDKTKTPGTVVPLNTSVNVCLSHVFC